MFDYLYQTTEDTKVHHVGFVTNDFRYDLALIYTNQFFGKTMILCIQSGTSALFDHSDLDDIDMVQSVFKLRTPQEAAEIANFLRYQISNLPFENQY
ncbi:DUF3055 domain-containing protein [Bacillus solitudinis]|uniref:DUF3055 domain-containing protein n=1 Tax=Bacillus solitudinis TaxID=2014074 RepID=UPI000C24E183|nr:DUF3055 domain-containing protein [Bacillus solitudinis]